MNREQQEEVLEKLRKTTYGYGGVVDPGEGGRQVKVTFQNMQSAAAWAQTFRMTSHVVLDTPAIVLDAPVALVFSLVAYAERMSAFLENIRSVPGNLA